jgi:hypothetical protein
MRGGQSAPDRNFAERKIIARKPFAVVLSTLVRSSSESPMAIRRGLALSATGIRRVSTPAAYVASMRSVANVSPRNNCLENTPLGRSKTCISTPSATAAGRRSARTVSTLRSTLRSIFAGSTPGRSKQTVNVSLLGRRPSAWGLAETRYLGGGRLCWASRSKCRKGSVRISMATTPLTERWVECDSRLSSDQAGRQALDYAV